MKGIDKEEPTFLCESVICVKVKVPGDEPSTFCFIPFSIWFH